VEKTQGQKKDASWKDLYNKFFTWTGDAARLASLYMGGCAIKLGEEQNYTDQFTVQTSFQFFWIANVVR